MKQNLQPQKRVSKWDNIKGILIVLVVFGHSILPFFENSDLLKATFLWINTFHMPLFIFVSGLFSKKTVNAPKLNIEKIISYILIFYFMKITIYFSVLIVKGKATFSLLYESGTPWYIFVSACFIVITYLVKNLNPKKVFVTAVLFGLGAGYFAQISHTLMLSRMIVFYPFFFLGYILDKDKIATFSNRVWVKFVSLGILIFYGAVLIFFSNELYGLRFLFTGSNPYANLPESWVLFGPFLRFGVYLLSSVIGFAVISVTPQKFLPILTHMGSNTLPIYALHRQILYFFQFSPLPLFMANFSGSVCFILLLLASFILSFVLSLKPFAYLLYPCTRYKLWLAPFMRWFKK